MDSRRATIQSPCTVPTALHTRCMAGLWGAELRSGSERRSHRRSVDTVPLAEVTGIGTSTSFGQPLPMSSPSGPIPERGVLHPDPVGYQAADRVEEWPGEPTENGVWAMRPLGASWLMRKGPRLVRIPLWATPTGRRFGCSVGNTRSETTCSRSCTTRGQPIAGWAVNRLDPTRIPAGCQEGHDPVPTRARGPSHRARRSRIFPAEHPGPPPMGARRS